MKSQKMLSGLVYLLGSNIYGKHEPIELLNAIQKYRVVQS